MANLHAMDAGSSVQLVTFASPRVGGKNTMCSGRRYFIASDWGDDPVPGLPPWTSHPASANQLKGSWGWFSKNYELDALGCGNDSGGGVNVYQHFSFQYKNYMERVLGLV